MRRTIKLVADLGAGQEVTVTVSSDGVLTESERRLVHDFVNKFFDEGPVAAERDTLRAALTEALDLYDDKTPHPVWGGCSCSPSCGINCAGSASPPSAS